jgi:hypothetical protein
MNFVIPKVLYLLPHCGNQWHSALVMATIVWIFDEVNHILNSEAVIAVLIESWFAKKHDSRLLTKSNMEPSL